MIQLAFVFFGEIILAGLVYNYCCNSSFRKKKLIFWCTGLFLILFAGLRDIGIDQDSLGYLNYYQFKEAIWVIAEPTFGIISEFVRYVFHDFRYVLLIYAILGVYLKFKAISLLTNLIWLTILVYFTTFYLLHDFTQIRAGVASGLFLLAIVELSKGRKSRYLCFILLASLFHYSSLVFILLYYFTNNPIDYKGKWIIALAIPVGIIFHFYGINPIAVIPIETVKIKLEIYQKAQQEAIISLNVFNMVYLIKYLLLYLILAYYSTISKYTIYVSILLKIYAFSLFLYLALSNNTILAMRISELLGIVEIFIIPYIFYIVHPKQFGALFVVIISFIYLLINIFYLKLIYPIPITSYMDL